MIGCLFGRYSPEKTPDPEDPAAGAPWRTRSVPTRGSAKSPTRRLRIEATYDL